MRTRGHHRTGNRAGRRAGAVALAGLTLVSIGAGTPAHAADQPAPGGGSTGVAPKSEQKPEKSEPKPVQDLTPPQRPTLGEASTEPGGTVRIDVLAESGSALVVREGAEVVASAAGTGVTQTLTWRTSSGPHTFLVIATDAAGNVSDPAPVTLQVDATPPSAKNFTVIAGTDRDSRSRWGVVTEPGTTYELIVDGNTLAEGVTERRTVKERLLLPDGEHEITLELRDGVGNVRTLDETVNIDIPALWVAAKDVSEPNSTERTFKVATAPGTRGFLRIPGAGNARFELPEGRAEVTIEVEEGSYAAPVVTVADDLDRKGSMELAAFEVDLTAPVVQVETTPGAGERGVLSAAITAGEGDLVSWRLIADSGMVTMSGEFVADGAAQMLEREVAKGNYELEVTATDANGNTTTDTVTAPVSARPMVNPDVVPALTITLALWALVGLVLVLRRRADRRRKLAGMDDAPRRGLRTKRAQLVAEHAAAVAEHEEQRAAFERDNEAWEQRRAQLAQLADVARGARVPADRADVDLEDDERVYCIVPAALVELQERDGVAVPVEVEAGKLVVTDARIIFSGSQQREWALGSMEQLRHLGPDRTMMTVSDQDTTSGVAYADADIVRLYLELAMAEAKGSSRSVRMMLEQGVRSHELRRPQAPAPVGPAPARGRLGRRTKADASAVVPTGTVASAVVPTGTVVEPAAVAGTEAPVQVTSIVQQAEPADDQIGRELVLHG